MICATPVRSLPDCIRDFNRLFERTFDPDMHYSRSQLVNMQTYCEWYGQPMLAMLFARHAENAEEII